MFKQSACRFTDVTSPGFRRRHARVWPLFCLLSSACSGVPPVSTTLQGQAVTSEAGESVTISVVLARRPSAPVTVYAVSSDEAEGLVSAPVHFHWRNWRVPQLITVTGTDDALDDGDAAYDVTLYATTGHVDDGGLELETLQFANIDDEVASFEGLGDLPGGDRGSHVTDVSASGDVVVGFSYGSAGEEAFRWRAQQGLQGLGGAPSRAQSVSPNGAWIAGAVSGERHTAALWRDDLPLELLVDPADPRVSQATFAIVEGNAVTDEGRVYGTCLQVGAYGEPLMCHFGAPAVVQTFGGGHVYAADAADNFAGDRLSLRRPPLFATAMFNRRGLPYPADARPCTSSVAYCAAEARDFSAGGAQVVGTARMPAPGFDTLDRPPLRDTAFVYTQADGMQRLADLEGGEEATGAYAISPDGRAIGGFGTDAAGRHAVIWIDRIPHRLADLLADHDGGAPDGWLLLDVRAMSADARVLVGNATNAEGAPEGFRVALPIPL